MQSTKVIPAVRLAELGPAGKLAYAYSGFLPFLALCIAAPAWSQSAPDLRGPGPRPTNPSIAAPAANPAGAERATDSPASTEHPYRFITIEIEGGSANAVANGINDDGLVTGYYQEPKSIYHGFVWRDGAVEKVNYPGATSTLLYGVNNRGVAIGYYADTNTTQHAVTYSVESRTWKTLPEVPGYSQNEGYGINDDGIAVGSAFEGNTSVAWIWDPDARSYSRFAVPRAVPYSTSPSGLNDKGQIAGYFVDASTGFYRGFLKEYGTYTVIDYPGALETFLDGINNHGVIQGQIFLNADYVAEGFTATSGGLFSIVNYPGPTGPEMTALVGINDHGDVCGGWGTFGSGYAFIALRSK